MAPCQKLDQLSESQLPKPEAKCASISMVTQTWDFYSHHRKHTKMVELTFDLRHGLWLIFIIRLPTFGNHLGD